MRRANKLMALSLAGAALVGVPAAAGAPTQPTPGQIRTAIATATRARTLWATINTCGYDGDAAVGIRGEMPALSFPTHLLMVVRVEEFSATQHRYVPIAHSYKLGGQVFSGGAVVQEGLRLKFGAAVTLIAKVDFEWFRDGKRLGSTTRTTTAGHRDAHGLPAGYSVATCSLR